MSKLKKYGIITVMIIVSVLSILLPIYILPNEVSNKIEAVMFENKTDTAQAMTIKIDGYFNRRLFGGTRFYGKIKMEGVPLKKEYQNQQIQIKFGNDQIGILTYLEEGDGKIRFVQKGYISMPMDLSYAVIVLTDGEKAADAKVENGTFISGPSTDREQSVELANEKLGKILEKSKE